MISIGSYPPNKWLLSYHKKYNIKGQGVKTANGKLYALERGVEENKDLNRLKKRNLTRIQIIAEASYHCVSYLMTSGDLGGDKTMNVLIDVLNHVNQLIVIPVEQKVLKINQVPDKEYIKRVLLYGTNDPKIKKRVQNPVEQSLNFYQQFFNQYIETNTELELFHLFIHHHSLLISYFNDFHQSSKKDSSLQVLLNLILHFMRDLIQMNHKTIIESYQPQWLISSLTSSDLLDKLVESFKETKKKDTEKSFKSWIRDVEDPIKTTMQVKIKSKYTLFMMLIWNLTRFFTRFRFGNGVNVKFLNMFNPMTMLDISEALDVIYAPHIRLLDYINQIYPMIRIISKKNQFKFYIVKPFNILKPNVLRPSHLVYLISDGAKNKKIPHGNGSVEIDNYQLSYTIKELDQEDDLNTLIKTMLNVGSVFVDNDGKGQVKSKKPVNIIKKAPFVTLYKLPNDCNVSLKIHVDSFNEKLVKVLKRSYGANYKLLNLERIQNFIDSYHTVYIDTFDRTFNKTDLRKLKRKDPLIYTFLEHIQEYNDSLFCEHATIPILPGDIQSYLDAINGKQVEMFQKRFLDKMTYQTNHLFDLSSLTTNTTILVDVKENQKKQYVLFTMNEKQILKDVFPLWFGFFFGLSLFTLHQTKQELSLENIHVQSKTIIDKVLDHFGRIVMASTYMVINSKPPKSIKLIQKDIDLFKKEIGGLLYSVLEIVLQLFQDKNPIALTMSKQTIKKYNGLKKYKQLTLKEKEELIEKKQQRLEKLLMN